MTDSADPTPDAQPAPAPAAPPARSPRDGWPAWRVAAVVYVVCAVTYLAFANDRLRTHSPDNHYSYLADSILHGTLRVRCEADVAAGVACPPGNGGNDWARYQDRWYVAFPAFPAVLYALPVAVLGRDFPNRAFDPLLAGFAPAFLFLLLEKLARKGRSLRTRGENLAFTALFAFGSVYFFTAVQGSVWFTAHVVGAALVALYAASALDAERPLVAGILLGLAIHTRPSLAYAAPWFAFEALHRHQRAGTETASGLRGLLRNADLPRLLRSLVLFAAPVALAIGIQFAMNQARFDDFREVGYRYLQIGWRGRIERWGLFNYHYLSRNLAIALASLPWISRTFPFVTLSRHGLALWLTTPQYLSLLRARIERRHVHAWFLFGSALTVLLVDLTYQNSGWIQFGYRFSNDVAVLLVTLLALHGPRFGAVQRVLLVLAMLVNGFGAATFDREFSIGGRRFSFYDDDASQTRYFQPD